MNRRKFLVLGAAGAAGAWIGTRKFTPAFPAISPLPRKVAASDTVVLGNTGIRTSRLAMGTGTIGFGHQSNQTPLGLKGLSDMLVSGYDQGLRFFDAADAYGSHPHVAEALQHDLDRFRRELGTDYIDICLMLCLTEGYLDRALPGREGCPFGGEGKRHHPGARLLVPLDRSIARGSEIAVGGG